MFFGGEVNTNLRLDFTQLGLEPITTRTQGSSYHETTKKVFLKSELDGVLMIWHIWEGSKDKICACIVNI